MSRATLESALYIWRHWSEVEVKEDTLEISCSVPKKTSLKDMIKQASRSPYGIFDDRLKSLADDVKDVGDLMAHLVEKSMREGSHGVLNSGDTLAEWDELAERTLSNLASILIPLSSRIRKEKVRGSKFQDGQIKTVYTLTVRKPQKGTRVKEASIKKHLGKTVPCPHCGIPIEI